MVVQELEQLKEVNTKLRNKMAEEKQKTDEKQVEREKVAISAGLDNVDNKEKTGEKQVAQSAQDNKDSTKNKQPEPKSEAKVEDKKPETKKKVEKSKVKKSEAIVKGKNLPISTKDSKFICKFIKNKTIEQAVKDLQEVIVQRKIVPMTGEIPHRKGKGVMSGRYPKKASENFLKLLKSLQGNANQGNLEEPIIVEAVANIGERPYGRFGRTRKKRSHVTIKVKEKSELKKMNKERK